MGSLWKFVEVDHGFVTKKLEKTGDQTSPLKTNTKSVLIQQYESCMLNFGKAYTAKYPLFPITE